MDCIEIFWEHCATTALYYDNFDQTFAKISMEIIFIADINYNDPYHNNHIIVC